MGSGVRVESVRVVGRFRKDLGDVASLARSITAVGLLNPITITADGHLIAGQRRLEACRSLGWEFIPARVVDNLTDAAERLTAERDENTERKDMTVEELVRLGQALEALERPKAEARKAQAPGQPRGEKVSGDQLTTTEADGKTREVVGRALGMSGTTYQRAKTVVETADDATLPPHERQVAREALDEMNTTGNVNGSYEKARKVRDGRVGAPRQTVIADLKKQRRAIGRAAAQLTGLTLVLGQVGTIHPDITSEEAAQWVDDLSEARRVLEILIRRLKERTNA